MGNKKVFRLFLVLGAVVALSEIGNYIVAQKILDVVDNMSEVLQEPTNVRYSWEPFNPGVSFDIKGDLDKEPANLPWFKGYLPAVINMRGVSVHVGRSITGRLAAYFGKPDAVRVSINTYDFETKVDRGKISFDESEFIMDLNEKVFSRIYMNGLRIEEAVSGDDKFKELARIKRVEYNVDHISQSYRRVDNTNVPIMNVKFNLNVDDAQFSITKRRTLDHLHMRVKAENLISPLWILAKQDVVMKYGAKVGERISIPTVKVRVGDADINARIIIRPGDPKRAIHAKIFGYRPDNITDGLVKAGWIDPSEKSSVENFFRQTYMETPIKGMMFDLGRNGQITINNKPI